MRGFRNRVDKSRRRDAGSQDPAYTARWGTIALGVGAFAVILLALRLWPHAPLRDRVPISTAVWSADGELLRLTRAADDQYRMWTPLDDISPVLIDAFVTKEDRWFYWHPGVNPASLARAAYRTYRGHRREGGSTLTMQLVRMLDKRNTRTPSGKLRQTLAAIWLEARYSKREILEVYLNVAPFGGNLQGVGVAARVYFGKPPDRVTLGEALTLAVIPQHPTGRAGGAGSDASLLTARAALGHAWLARHGDSDDDRRQIDLPIVAHARTALPYEAPHAVDALVAAHAGRIGRLDTTLDASLQRLIERRIAQYLTHAGDRGIRNVSALLVDWRDLSVKAWVGSADYWSESIDGQVNGVFAKRSPGSTLKPFAYALALDQGVIHPRTMLRDAPTSFGPFAPENFDGRFFGPISAEEALVRSRNIPAVWVATQLKEPSLYQFLQTAGVRAMKSESFYGLALALGGGELTMEELVMLYAMLANGGVLKQLRIDPGAPASEGVRLLSAEAAFITLDMLRRNPRPDEDGTVPVRTRWPVAWKTGTSWGFRDAWSIGVVGPYVLAIWIGDFDGRGNPAFVGVDAAAPLFFRIVDALNLARPDEPVPPSVPPSGVARVAVCVESGDLPNRYCPHTVDTWYIPGKSPIRVSQLHRAIGIDPIAGTARCAPYPADTRVEVFEVWSSDMLKLFRQAGMPRRSPPSIPDCVDDESGDPPVITSPIRNVSYALRHSGQGDTIALEASVAGDVGRVFWFDGSALIGAREVGDGALAWRPSSPGLHLIRIVDDHGRSAERDVEVQIAQ